MESAVPAINDAFVLQSSRTYATAEATRKGPTKETTPIPTDAPESAAHVRRVYLHPGEESQDDGRELGDEVEPLLRLEMKEVACDDAERQFKQRYGDAEFDRQHARKEHNCGEDCC